MKYLPLVWGALWRKPVEDLLTFLAVAAAFTLFSMMVGMNLNIRQTIDRSRTDRLWVRNRFAFEGCCSLTLAMSGQIARFEGVTAVGADRDLMGYHADPHNQLFITFVDEGMRAAWSEGSLTPAQWDELFATPSGIFVSAQAAAKWGLKKGDIFTVITPPGTRLDGGTSWDFQVLGVVPDDRHRAIMEGFMIGNSEYLENTLPLDQRGTGYVFEVALTDGRRANEISRQIDQYFADSGTATATIPKRAEEQAYVNRGIDTTSLTENIAAAGLGMILFLTANAIARSVRERVPEFAVLQTLGFRHVHLVALVFAEASVPCLLGAACGTFFALVLDRWSAYFLPESLASFSTAPMPVLSILGWALALALVLASISSAIPTLKLRHLSVTDALAGR